MLFMSHTLNKNIIPYWYEMKYGITRFHIFYIYIYIPPHTLKTTMHIQRHKTGIS